MELTPNQKMRVECDAELKALIEEHRSLDDLLVRMDRKGFLTPDEEVERRRLHKLKLAKKDRISEILETN